MTSPWVSMPATEVRPGDRIRLGSGAEMEISRIDTGFLGMDSMICLVESTSERWFAQPVPVSAEIEVRRAP